MAIRSILRYPNPRLEKVSSAVKVVDDATKRLISDMFETMYDAPGIGLAAPQVDVCKRIMVVDVSENRSQPLAFINPEIIESEGKEVTEEGCLSVPGIYEIVERADKIKVKALDREGNSFEMEADGLLSVCIQHEIDHLDGKLFVDYLSSLKRIRIRKKMEKSARQSM